ncbi:MAG: AAA family ATPase [Gammaproteobacteria bacterium]|nr:AAA family ATPase [Gammaproteobacteria bacterium]
MNNNNNQIPLFIQAMLKHAFYDHSVQHCELIETHISWVILTGQFVYKIKKPVNFGFLDFSTLEKRKFYCEEELRLNRRLAPEIYLDVIALTGSTDKPEFNGNGVAFEYAVKMTQFSQEAEFDHLLTKNELSRKMIDSTAILIADFHQQIEITSKTSEYGKPERVYQPIHENFVQIRERETRQSTLELLSEIEHWCEDTYTKIKPVLTQRKQAGYIRECHGDLHLRNLAWFENKPLAFDCLEFNPNFRWIDVISEVAFFVMDLEDHKQPEFAQRFLNEYLELTGDYQGCHVLRFYLVYRAMVRAKVAAIRSHQAGIDKHESDEANTEFYSYLKLALAYTKPKTPFIIITRGLSASGKSRWSQILLEKFKAIRIRSDVERKRLFNIAQSTDSHENIEQGIYSAEATNKTYSRLLELAEEIMDAGLPVIVDATFSLLEQRNLFKALAIKKQARFVILEFFAAEEILKQRIINRKNDVSDADINVLENQLKHWQALEKNEKADAILINTGEFIDLEQLLHSIKSRTSSH